MQEPTERATKIGAEGGGGYGDFRSVRRRERQIWKSGKIGGCG